MTAASESSTLLRYFIHPSDPLFDDMLYATYYTNFTTSKASSDLATGKYWHESGAIPHAAPHIMRWRVCGEKIVCIHLVWPRFGDVFYLRLLLHHAARSFDALCMVNGVVYDTFQHAARAAGLLEEDDEGQLTMEDVIAKYKSASQLRFLFVLHITEGAGAVELWERFKDDLACNSLGIHSVIGPNGFVTMLTIMPSKILSSYWVSITRIQQHLAFLL